LNKPDKRSLGGRFKNEKNAERSEAADDRLKPPPNRDQRS